MSDTSPPPNKQSADAVLGRPRPQPKRFSRRAVLGITTVLTALAVAALVYGLEQHPTHKNTATEAPTAQAPNPFTDLQGGYPKPLPAPAAKTAPAPAAVAAAPPPLTPKITAPEVAQRPKQLTEDEQLALEAGKAGVFFDRGRQDNGAQDAPAGGPAGNGSPTAPGTDRNGISSDPQAARQGSAYGTADLPQSATGGLTAQKNAFIANSGNTGSDYARPAVAPLSPYEVMAGTIIPAALQMKSNSDLPGDMIARVTENVFDTTTGQYLLIPQGSKLYGKYDSMMAYGQSRSLIIWNRLILPNGNSEDLGGMIGTDAEGQSGMTGDVNHHIWSLAGALAFSTVLSVGPSLASGLSTSSGSGTTIYQAPLSQLGSNGQTIGEQFLDKELNRPNTITVFPGSPLRVLVNKDMILPPYTP